MSPDKHASRTDVHTHTTGYRSGHNLPNGRIRPGHPESQTRHHGTTYWMPARWRNPAKDPTCPKDRTNQWGLDRRRSIGHSKQVQRTLQTLCDSLPRTNSSCKVLNSRKSESMQLTRAIHLQCSMASRCHPSHILHRKWTEKTKRYGTVQNTSSITPRMHNRKQHPTTSILPASGQWGKSNIQRNIQIWKNKVHRGPEKETTTSPPHSINAARHTTPPTSVHSSKYLNKTNYNHIHPATTYPQHWNDTPCVTSTGSQISWQQDTQTKIQPTNHLNRQSTPIQQRTSSAGTALAAPVLSTVLKPAGAPSCVNHQTVRQNIH